MDGSENYPHVVTSQLYAKQAWREKICDHNEAGSSEEVEQSPVRRT